jgi:hypothetical protein
MRNAASQGATFRGRQVRLAWAACVLLLAGCQTIPGSEVLDRDPWQGTRFTSGAVPVPGLAARLTAGPGDPLQQIPARLNLALTPDSWTLEFAEKILDLAKSTMSEKSLGSMTDPVTLASYYVIIGRRDHVHEVEKLFKARSFDGPGDLDAECKSGNSCANEAKKHLQLAALAYLRGDTASAERIFQHTERYATRAQSERRQTGMANVLLANWFDARSTYLLISGRIPDAIASYKAWRRWEREENALDSAEFNFRKRLELVRLSGRTREAVTAARLIGRDPDLGHLVVIDLVMSDMDILLQQRGSTSAARAYLKVAMEFPGYYPKARPLWHNLRALDFECHAGRIAAVEGDKQAAAAVLDAVLPLYREMPEDGFELGYCLMRLAERLGHNAAKPVIVESMTRQRAYSAKRIEAANAAYIHGVHSNGRSNLSHSMERTARAMHKVRVVTVPSPKTLVFLQSKSFENSLIQALEATKDPQIESHRGNNLADLFAFAFMRYHLVGED